MELFRTTGTSVLTLTLDTGQWFHMGSPLVRCRMSDVGCCFYFDSQHVYRAAASIARKKRAAIVVDCVFGIGARRYSWCMHSRVHSPVRLDSARGILSCGEDFSGTAIFNPVAKHITCLQQVRKLLSRSHICGLLQMISLEGWSGFVRYLCPIISDF